MTHDKAVRSTFVIKYWVISDSYMSHQRTCVTEYENVFHSFLGNSDLDVRLYVKSKLRLNSYGERTRGRQRSLNVLSKFSWKHVLWWDRSKYICIHDVWTPIAVESGALFCPSAAKIMIAT
jgi:hypothetical protein